MCNRYIASFCCLLLFIGITACNKDFLDRKPLDSYSDDDVWSDINLVEAFVNSRYTILPFPEAQGVQKAYFMSGACDEGYSKFNYGNEITLVTDQLSPDNNVYDFWADNYVQLRNCNMFLSRIDGVPAVSADDIARKSRLTGEICFLRAYGYFDLIQHYGGVPIVDKLYSLKDTSYAIARSSFDNCVTFILKDIDSAIAHLPASYTSDPDNTGRATSTGSYALKSRLLLYAASPLHNPSNDAAKWQKALTATKAAIDFAEANGYSLYQGSDYKDIFRVKWNSEIITAYNFSSVPGGGMDIVCSPNSYGGWSVYTPTQGMVDAFEMKNGKSITDATSGYDAAHPYDNRDPRFYADILYNGTVFKGVATEFYAGGKDSKDGPQGWNATETGYCWRKYLSETINVNSESSNQNWVIFRLAELYLNYAEAAYETGDEATARTYINKIRSRASVQMPGITDAGSALLARIQQERRIELCFESQRIYDVRRWKIAPNTESQPARGVQITKNNDGTFTYNYFTVQEREWSDKLYLWPISRSEINKNPLLVNNDGYN